MGALIDGLVTFGVLLGLFVIVLCRVTKRTLGEVIQDVRGGIKDETSEVVELY